MYEVKFFYQDFGENGYSGDKKDFSIKIGTEEEETDEKDLVKLLTKEYARRDILITEVEVYEFVKKKINVKNIKGGFVIKHKKFMLDGDVIVAQEIKEEAPKNALVPVREEMAPGVSNFNGRPIKWVTLDPDEPNLMKVKQSGLAFLPNKRYPVISETPHPKQLGVMIYKIIDENKREMTVFDTYFLNADQKLARGFHSTVDTELEPKLSYGEMEKDNMPVIRSSR